MALPKFEDWSAPWEVDAAGVAIPEEDQKVDPKRIRKHLYNVLSDKEKLQETVKTEQAAKAELEKKVTEAAREGESESDKLRRQVEELSKKVAEGDAKSVETLKLEVALEKGLTRTQAKRLVGSNYDELVADADDLVASFGGSGEKPDGSTVVKRTPKKLHSNSDGDDDDTSSKVPAYSKDELNKLFPL